MCEMEDFTTSTYYHQSAISQPGEYDLSLEVSRASTPSLVPTRRRPTSTDYL